MLQNKKNGTSAQNLESVGEAKRKGTWKPPLEGKGGKGEVERKGKVMA